MKNKILVDICITTHNSGKFIEKTLRSALDQKTDFDFQILIFDDASTDDTIQIVKRLQEEFPDRIKIDVNDTNLGLVLNNWKAFEACTSKYMAILDSDDYWTDSHKLQNQIDFLEQNESFVMTFAKGTIMKNGERHSLFNTKGWEKLPEGKVGINDLLQSAQIWNSSVVYRNLGDKIKMPEWLKNRKYNQDYTRHILYALEGPIKYMNLNVGVYAIHGKNSSMIDDHQTEKKHLNSIFISSELLKIVPKRSRSLLRRQISRHYAIVVALNKSFFRKIKYFLFSLYHAILAKSNVKDIKDLYYLAVKNSFYKDSSA